MRATTIQRRRPYHADRLREEGAFSLRLCGSRKVTARGTGRSLASVDDWYNGAPSSPVWRHDTLLLAVADPWPLVAHARAVAMRSTMTEEPTKGLVRRFHELRRLEAEREGQENIGSIAFDQGGDIGAFAEQHEAEAATSLELAALTRELIARRVDPRTWRAS